MKMMRSAVLNGKGNIVLKDVPVPQVSGNRVLIRIKACGICGTDVLIYNGLFPVDFPYSPGHEITGTVVCAGPKVRRIKKGDRVAVDPNHPCGRCLMCKKGAPNLCDNLKTQGVKSNGGFSEYIMIPEKIVHPLPAGVSFQTGALAETLSCSLHTIEDSGIEKGDTVLVTGGGTMGIMNALLAKARGAGTVIISEPLACKRKLAEKLGVDLTIDPSKKPVSEALGKLGIQGADVVIESTGITGCIEEALYLLNKRGRLIMSGIPPQYKRMSLEPFDIVKKELTVKGTFLNPNTFAKALKFLKKNTRCFSALVTDVLPLSRIKKGLELAQSGKAVKVVICP